MPAFYSKRGVRIKIARDSLGDAPLPSSACLGEMSFQTSEHQYVHRDTGHVCSEQPLGDCIVNFFYAQEREHAPFVFKLLASQSFSRFLGWLNYDFPLGQSIHGGILYYRTFSDRYQ